MAALIAVTAGFASGVLLRSLFVFGWPIILFIALVGLMLFAARLVASRAAYLLCALFVIAAALGAARFHMADAPLPAPLLADLDTRVVYEGEVVVEPDVRDSHQRITVEVREGEEEARVFIVADRYPAVSYGDHVVARGVLALPEPFATDAGLLGQGRVFRYDHYLKKDGVEFIIEFGELDIIAKHEGFSLYGALYDLKHAFNAALSRALPEPEASLASGLILGGKQGLGEDLKEAFTIAGLIHIVVLSGYNVMIVAIAMMRFFVFLPRRAAATLAGITIGLFVLMAGAGAASMRAGLMAGLGLFARASARPFAALRALLVVGVALVAGNPFTPVFDPGFQLSFVATAGLILGAPLVAARFAFIRNEFFKEIAASTIAAQIAVLPLLLYQTGLFSLVALPANLLVLPAIPLAMGLSFFAGTISLVFPSLALVAGLPAHAVLSYIIAVAEGAAALPLSSLSIPAFPFIFVLIAYATLGYTAFVKRSSMTLQLMFSKKTST